MRAAGVAASVERSTGRAASCRRSPSRRSHRLLAPAARGDALRRGRNRHASSRARGVDLRDARRGRGSRCGARCSGDIVTLRRQPQHQLHQYLQLPLPVLRLLQRPRRQTLRGAAPTCSRSTRWRAARVEARARGATEVCLQGGIHPCLHRRHLSRYRAGGEGALSRHARARLLAARDHARRADLGLSRAGIPGAPAVPRGSRRLPGTAAEILDDEVRARHLPRQAQHRRNGST